MRRSLALIALCATASACGSQGAPLPPLRPLPPALAELTVAQRGTDAIIRFAPVTPTVSIEGTAVELDRIELLVLTDRYPEISPEILATSLDAERRERLDLAREAAERAERTLARQRGEEVEEAPTATEEPDEDAPSPEEILLRRVPSDARMAWREQEIRPEVLLESARRLEAGVDRLWEELGLPDAIVDLRRPPELPDPVRIIAAAERVATTIGYEGERSVEEFLLEAAVVAAVPIADLDDYRSDSSVQFVHSMAPPAGSEIRTRYFFAVRAVSVAGQEGAIGRVASLAPVAVPAPPAGLSATVTEDGVDLVWERPVADITGAEIEEERVGYNVYRRAAEVDVFTSTPLNDEPLREPEFLDEETGWDETWVYEVRSLRVEPEGVDDEEHVIAFRTETTTTPAPLKESRGAATGEVLAADVFPPGAPSQLEAVRAARTVTLRWRAAGGEDVEGYRVYRHAAPRPELPGWVPPDEDDSETEDDSAAEADAAAQPETEQKAEAATQEGAEEAGGEAAAAPAEQEEEEDEGRRRIRRNLLTGAGWELLTSVPVTDTRYIDPSSDPGQTWFYVVEAIDEAGNVGPPILVEVPATETPRESP